MGGSQMESDPGLGVPRNVGESLGSEQGTQGQGCQGSAATST